MEHPLRRFAPSPLKGGRQPRGGAVQPAQALACCPWRGSCQSHGWRAMPSPWIT